MSCKHLERLFPAKIQNGGWEGFIIIAKKNPRELPCVHFGRPLRNQTRPMDFAEEWGGGISAASTQRGRCPTAASQYTRRRSLSVRPGPCASVLMGTLSLVCPIQVKKNAPPPGGGGVGVGHRQGRGTQKEKRGGRWGVQRVSGLEKRLLAGSELAASLDPLPPG